MKLYWRCFVSAICGAITSRFLFSVRNYMNVDHSNMSYGEVGEDGEENVITLHSMLDGDDVAVDIGQTFAFVIIGVLSVSQAFDRDRIYFPRNARGDDLFRMRGCAVW